MKKVALLSWVWILLEVQLTLDSIFATFKSFARIRGGWGGGWAYKAPDSYTRLIKVLFKCKKCPTYFFLVA